MAGFGINGQEYQHALVELQAGTTGAAFRFARFKSVKYKDAAPKEAVTDHLGQQVGYTIKPQKIDASMSMLLSEWFRYRAFLRAQAAAISAQIQRPVGIGQVPVDMTVSYGATLTSLQKDILRGVMIQEEPRESTDNQEALVVEIPLFVLRIEDANVKDGNANTFVAYGQ